MDPVAIHNSSMHLQYMFIRSFYCAYVVQVQGMANSIYSEFKRMMSIYGEDAIKELMPLIVTILEALDRSLTDSNGECGPASNMCRMWM